MILSYSHPTPFSLEFTISSYFSTCLIHHTHVLVTSFPHVYHPDSQPEPGALYISPTLSTAVHIASGVASDPAPKPHLITCASTTSDTVSGWPLWVWKSTHV